MLQRHDNLGTRITVNTISFPAQAFVTLEKCELQAKWSALQAYKSQFELGRPYFSWEFIESWPAFAEYR